MCDLLARLEQYARDESIDLTYRWKGKNAKDVDVLFSQWHNELVGVRTASPKASKGKLASVIDQILKWGGINRLKAERRDHYVEKIRLGISRGQEIDENTLLSSWTKILAAYEPEEYWIYDSRVAIALKTLVPEYDWFIPTRRNDSVGSFLRNRYTNALTEAESYEKYLSLLSGVDARRRRSCEQKLFMLGGQITINAARHCSNPKS